MKSRVYIETTVVSYLAARPGRDLIVSARQEITRAIWPRLLSEFESVISALVIKEASKGDIDAAEKRMDILKDIPVLDITDESIRLADKLIKAHVIPVEYADDALHISIASVNGAEYLITWNFSHMNNVFTRSRIKEIIEKNKYYCPVICSPEELLGDLL